MSNVHRQLTENAYKKIQGHFPFYVYVCMCVCGLSGCCNDGMSKLFKGVALLCKATCVKQKTFSINKIYKTLH